MRTYPGYGMATLKESTTAISIATALCSQIAVAVAVDGLPTHAATDLFNLSQFSDSNNVGPRL